MIFSKEYEKFYKTVVVDDNLRVRVIAKDPKDQDKADMFTTLLNYMVSPEDA